MNNEMMSVKDAAIKWDISIRRVQDLCKNGKVVGATRFGASWMIPSDAKKPVDRRYKSNKEDNQIHFMPKQSPLLTMTNLYNAPGKASRVSRGLKNNVDAKDLFDAEIAYYQGNIEKCIEIINRSSTENKDIYFLLGKNFLFCLCAIWKGDITLWNEAYKSISTIHCQTEQEKNVVALTYAALYCSLLLNPQFLDWFEKGNFERVPADMHPFAKVYYAKLNYMAAVGVATKQIEFYDTKGLNLMHMISHTVEPLISQAVVDQTVIPEIYLRLNCALSYQYSGKNEDAIYHLDRAVSLALKDKLYGILAEFLYRYDFLLEERLMLIDEEACKEIKDLFYKFQNGWSTLSSTLRHRSIATNLTQREREIGRLISFGFTNKQIAKILSVSEETIKSTVKNIMHKTGLTDRADFFSIL